MTVAVAVVDWAWLAVWLVASGGRRGCGESSGGVGGDGGERSGADGDGCGQQRMPG
ncbi:hypothetical protein [Acrocarpospora corrugata]|uniref:hypothetical protein n=1 Tax=Acrocarpospora corrugata TaxID=35763 RepID=UPI001478DA47|nr:hypothetical protein [Acrocarpospora corrugata]